MMPGKIVYNEELNNEGSNKGTVSHQVDISTLTKGIYIVNVQTERGSTFKRLVI